MLLTLSLLWGSSFFFVEVVISELPPLTVVFLRVALAAAALWFFAIVIGLRPPMTIGAWTAFLIMGLLNNVIPFTLIAWGQTHIASGLASILTATTPLFTVTVAGILLADERNTPMKLIGVTIGFFGVILMIGPSALSGMGVGVLAQIAVLSAAMSYAFAGVFGRRFKAMGINPIITAAGQVTASAIILAPFAIYIDRPFSLEIPDVETITAIIGLAILSTAVAYILYFRILASAGFMSDYNPYDKDPTGTFFNRVQTFEIGEFPNTQTVHFPKSCLHCEEPPCVPVCPTGASYKREQDGIVLVDYDKCIGCKYCSWACPYGAREIDENQKVMKKCTLCVDRIYDETLPEAERKPACVLACPTSARLFGDVNDPDSIVSEQIRDNGGYQLMPEWGTKPANHYLPRRKANIIIHRDELTRVDNPLNKERQIPMPGEDEQTLDDIMSW